MLLLPNTYRPHLRVLLMIRVSDSLSLTKLIRLAVCTINSHSSEKLQDLGEVIQS